MLSMAYRRDGTRGEQSRDERRPPARADPRQQEEQRGDGKHARSGRHDANAKTRTLHLLHRVQDKRIEYRRRIVPAGVLEDFIQSAYARVVGSHGFVEPDGAPRQVPEAQRRRYNDQAYGSCIVQAGLATIGH